MIFLSHASRDKSDVLRIRKAIPHYMASWLDIEDIKIGDELTPAISDAILDKAEVFVIFVSEHAIASTWVDREINWALDKERLTGEKFILPVALDDSWKTYRVANINERLVLRLQGRSDEEIKAFADRLAAAITELYIEKYRLLREKFYTSGVSYVKAFRDREHLRLYASIDSIIASARTFDMIALAANVLIKHARSGLETVLERGGAVRLILLAPGRDTHYLTLVEEILKEKSKKIEFEELQGIYKDWKKGYFGHGHGKFECKIIARIPLLYNMWIKDLGLPTVAANLSVYNYRGTGKTNVFRMDGSAVDVIDEMSAEFEYVWRKIAKPVPSMASP